MSSPTTGFPVRSANAISESVPYAPPTATTASAARTTSGLRISPNPVVIATVTCGFAAPRSEPGSSPTTVPPAPAAPRDAASMTPPSPPHTTTAPASPSNRPTASARAASSVEASPGPITATYCACTRATLRRDRFLPRYRETCTSAVAFEPCQQLA